MGRPFFGPTINNLKSLRQSPILFVLEEIGSAGGPFKLRGGPPNFILVG
jgi:hypothetical protein